MEREYGLISKQELPKEMFDAIILTVAHNEFKNLDFKKLSKTASVIYDVKNVLSTAIKDKGL